MLYPITFVLSKPIIDSDCDTSILFIGFDFRVEHFLYGPSIRPWESYNNWLLCFLSVDFQHIFIEINFYRSNFHLTSPLPYAVSFWSDRKYSIGTWKYFARIINLSAFGTYAPFFQLDNVAVEIPVSFDT